MTKLSGLENLVARRNLIFAGAILVVVVLGLGFSPNLTLAVSVTKATGEITGLAELRSIQFSNSSDICQFASTSGTVPIPPSPDAFNKLADAINNNTISNLVQNLSSKCRDFQYAIHMESQYAPYTDEYLAWDYVAYTSLLAIHQIAIALPVGSNGNLPLQIQLIGFRASVTLTFNNQPFKIISVTTTNQNIQVSTFDCKASCYTGTITIGSMQAPVSSWEPIKITLTINYEVPIVWWSFRVSSSQRTLTVNIELNPATGTVQLA
jgi:hypothetical protein